MLIEAGTTARILFVIQKFMNVNPGSNDYHCLCYAPGFRIRKYEH
jgi:hypothetical protein